ncbi:MAG: NADH-quinone oxidoreductase subunit A [Candidatus Scalinduaceae bacterium]
MLIAYLPILIILIVVAGFAIANIVISALLGRHKPSVEKLSPYECGIEPTGAARERFSVKFYLIAMMFVIFDIEVVFLYPWAVVFKSLQLFGLIEMAIFIIILLICYVYIWKRGGFEWD